MRYFLFIFTLIFLAACTDSTSPDVTAVEQANAEATSIAGTESALAVEDASSDLETVEDLDNIDLTGDGTYTINQFAANFADLLTSMQNVQLQSGKRDSVTVLFESETNLPNGVVVVQRITYDWDSGIGHVQQIRRYPNDSKRALVMDSTDVTVDMGTTPFDNRDDQFKSVFEYRAYREDFQLESYTATFTLNDVSSDLRPRDFTATMDLKYRDGSLLNSVHISITRHSDHSGEFHKEVLYADGTKSQVDRTYNGDGTGTFHRLRPNGVEASGTFNVIRDDNQGGFTKTITFPEGFKTSKIEITGDFTLSQDYTTLTGTIVKIYTFADGTADTATVNITKTFTSQRQMMMIPLSLEISVSSTGGIEGEISIVYSETDAQMTGYWITEEGHYADLSGYRYFDDMSVLNIKLYENKEAKDNGDEPLATAVFETQADGSGVATITVGEEVYTFTYDASGRGKLTKLNRAISTVEARI